MFSIILNYLNLKAEFMFYITDKLSAGMGSVGVESNEVCRCLKGISDYLHIMDIIGFYLTVTY